jgi:hypothetical protein
MPVFTRESLRKAPVRTYAEISVPEWAPEHDPEPESWRIRLRSLTGRERDRFEASTAPKGQRQKQNLDNFRARLVVLCIVGEDNEPIFNNGDVKMVGEMNSAGLSRVFNKCNEMNGLTEEDVEELTEGFGSDPAESSTSD